jgi:hypothetical protein
MDSKGSNPDSDVHNHMSGRVPKAFFGLQLVFSVSTLQAGPIAKDGD